MRILVTGREGQVARSLQRFGAAAGHEIVTLGRPELDLAGDTESIVTSITSRTPELIVSAAAYTAVDLAEDEPSMAEAVNARGPAAIARAAKRIGVPLLHLSTDYVFDGTKPEAYDEADPTGPAGVYGRTKLAGEQAIMGAYSNVAVLRTAWVYSPFGRNFVRTMLNLARDRDEVRVVADQIGNPTSALDIAAALIAVGNNLVQRRDDELRGLFHLAAPDEASWADVAEQVFATSADLGGPTASVARITTAEFPTRARRPANSRLDCRRLAERHGVTLPSWRKSVAATVTELLASPLDSKA